MEEWRNGSRTNLLNLRWKRRAGSSPVSSAKLNNMINNLPIPIDALMLSEYRDLIKQVSTSPNINVIVEYHHITSSHLAKKYGRQRRYR